MKPNITFLRTKNYEYLYDGNTGKIIVINSLIRKIIETYWQSNDDDAILNLEHEYTKKDIKLALMRIEQVKEQGLLTTYPNRISLDGIINELKYDLENNISGICLSVTQECNLRCKYCVYSGIYPEGRVHSDKTMSFKVAKKAIDYAISKSSSQDKFTLSFYGGEPLLRFDFIKKCIEYMINEYHGKEIRFNITTNGTLLNEKYVEYLVRKNVLLHISLDGPQEYHDEYRKFATSDNGSFKIIEKNLLEIKKRHPKYYKDCVSYGVTLSPFRSLERIEDFLIEGNIVGEDNYTRVSRVNQGEQLNIYNDKKKEDNIIMVAIDERFANTRYIHSKIHGNNEYLNKSKIPLRFNEFIEEFHETRIIRTASEAILPSGCCIPGKDNLFVSTDGEFYICEKCNDDSELLKLGDVDNGIDKRKAEKILRDFYNSTEEECSRCWAHIWCYTCPVQIEKNVEQSRNEKLKRCQRVKSSIKRGLVYYLTILEKNPYAFDK